MTILTSRKHTTVATQTTVSERDCSRFPSWKSELSEVFQVRNPDWLFANFDFWPQKRIHCIHLTV